MREAAEYELEDVTLCWCLDQPTNYLPTDYYQKARHSLAEPKLPDFRAALSKSGGAENEGP